MKNLKNIFLAAGAMALCSVGFTSCDDDDNYDFMGDAYNRVYTADHSGAFKIVQTPAGAMGSWTVKIPAKCNQKAAGDIKVTIEVDNSLIDAYNQEHGTNYVALPEEALVIENGVLTIPAGEMASADTTVVKLTDSQEVLLTLTNSDGYIVPVRMTQTTGGSAKPATSVKSTSYLTMTVTNDAVNHDGTLEDSKGTPVADQSGWSLTGNVDTSEGYKLFDGDAKNYTSFESGEDMELIVDMGKEYSFDAIEAKYAYGWGSWSYDYGSLPNETRISISSDGTKWQSVGIVEAASSWDSPSSVVFWGSLTARYIKLNIPATESYWGNSASFECGYFNVYAL